MIPGGGPVAAIHLLDKTYNETLTLLVTARDYMSYAVPAGRPTLEPAQRLRVSCEAMRVTARLSHVMAWLLAQRAVQAGEITPKDAAAAYRLSDDDICMLETETSTEEIPLGLRDLLEKSRALYVRVTRLDELVRRAAAAEAD
jgi:regulator of CtrA degradation